MVQFLSINFFFLDFFNFLLGFSKVPIFLCQLYLPFLLRWFRVAHSLLPIYIIHLHTYYDDPNQKMASTYRPRTISTKKTTV